MGPACGNTRNRASNWISRHSLPGTNKHRLLRHMQKPQSDDNATDSHGRALDAVIVGTADRHRISIPPSGRRMRFPDCVRCTPWVDEPAPRRTCPWGRGQVWV